MRRSHTCVDGQAIAVAKEMFPGLDLHTHISACAVFFLKAPIKICCLVVVLYVHSLQYTVNLRTFVQSNNVNLRKSSNSQMQVWYFLLVSTVTIQGRSSTQMRNGVDDWSVR